MYVNSDHQIINKQTEIQYWFCVLLKLITLAMFDKENISAEFVVQFDGVGLPRIKRTDSNKD